MADKTSKHGPPAESNKGQGKPGDKDKGQSDEDFYEKQAKEVGEGGKT